MTVLPLTYLGSTAWFARLVAGECATGEFVAGECVVDVHENWVKQTARNRCDIATAGGVASLTVPVHAAGAKIATRDVRIDNSKRWQHVHWGSLVAAYRNSPFFDHYAERFAPFYEQKYDWLVDFNVGLTRAVLTTLGLNEDVLRLSEKYVEARPEDIDLRGKKSLRPECETLVLPPYTQVFADRGEFAPNVSIIDLVMCESARGALSLLRMARG
ncbi:MAG: WbqC family protein [Rikenellaceae bacterium]|jgi:hypothetical protein|nr:WbqC family protein [Rikenellaceae bacterium]